MSKKKEPQVTAEDLFNKVFKDQKALMEAIQQDREHLNKLTENVNQLTSAVSAVKTAKATNPGGKGVEGFLGTLEKGIAWFMKDGYKLLAEPEAKPTPNKFQDLQDSLVRKTYENAIKKSDIEIKILQKRLDREGKTGWNIL